VIDNNGDSYNMVFNPLAEKSTNKVVAHTIPELQQQTPIESLAGGDVQKAELIKENERRKILRTMNAFKIIHPIISALMERPGVDAEAEDLSANFRTLIKETSGLSEKICYSLGVDPTDDKNFWIRNVFERIFADYLKEQWLRDGKLNVNFIENCIEQAIKIENVSTENNFEEMSPIVSSKMSLIKALIPVVKEVENFDLFRGNVFVEKDLEGIGEKLKEASLSAVTKLTDEYNSTKDKTSLFNLVLQEAGEIYAIAWRSESKRVIELMSSYGEDEVNKQLQKYPDGLPLDKVNHDFNKYFNKLVAITEKLVPSKKGTIEKRLRVAAPS